MNKVHYKNVDEMIDELVIKEKSNYFICKCPECDHDEAFIYKNNLNTIKCSRENNCGETTYIDYEEKIENDKKIIFNENDGMSIEEQENVKTVSVIYTLKEVDFPTNFTYRGLEKEILKKADVYLAPKDTKFEVDFKSDDTVTYPIPINKLQSRLAHYDLIFPIKNKNNWITRLVYRSLDDKQFVKEYCRPLVQSSDDVLKLDLDLSTVVISESIIDGLSIKQSYDAGLYACRGVNKVNKLIAELESKYDFWKDKTILIGLDNDNAGEKYYKVLKNKCDELNINSVKLTVPNNLKDWNEVLCNYGKEYITKKIDSTIRNEVFKQLNNKNLNTVYNLSKKHLEIAIKNPLLQESYLNIFSSQIGVGPVNSMLLDLQYKSSFFANQEVIEKLNNAIPSNTNLYDCELLKLGENENEFSLINDRTALQKNLVKKNINYDKAFQVLNVVLKKYNYDKDITVGPVLKESFETLSKELINQNFFLIENRDIAHTLFLKNFPDFKDKKFNFDDKLELKHIINAMKTNHSLLNIFSKNEVFEYQLENSKSLQRGFIKKEDLEW
ncbi:MAG: toprim domain-containing protein [Bacilli bacterium]